MVTIGRGVVAPAVHDFFEGLRSYDVARAVKGLAADVDFEAPWTPKLTGKDKVEAFLSAWLKDPVKRPSFSIIDAEGDGTVTRLKLSVSGRFGQAPQHVTLHALCLQGVLHHLKFVAPAKGGH